MPSIRLTQRRVDALRPRHKVRDIRNAELKGYGARVTPSGTRRYFIHGQHRGKRVWKVIGDAAAIAEPEARARARSMLAALRDGRPTPRHPVPLPAMTDHSENARARHPK